MVKSKNAIEFCGDVKGILIDYPSRSYSTGRGRYYLDIPCGIDIYTSTAEIDGEIRAVTYAIYISIGDIYIICRRTEEVETIYNNLQKYLIHNHIILYAGNIRRIYWQYRKRIPFDGFRDKDGEPLRLGIGNVEIRDFKRIALYKIPKIEAKSGIYPDTELDPEEEAEIESVGLRIHDDITRRIESDGGAGHIPLTLSGYAKRELTRSQRGAKCWIKIDRKEYNICKRAYIGGYCAISPTWKCEDIKGNIISYDEDSAFIAVMLSEQFPAKDGIYWERCTGKEFHKITSTPGIVWIGRIEFKGIRLKPGIPCGTIPEIRASVKGRRKVYSGFLTAADYARLSICSADFQILEKCYTWEGMRIDCIYTYEADYMPRYIVKSLCKLYEDKARLKGKPGREYLFAKRKAILNSCYGLFGVSPVAWGSIERYNKRFDRIGCYQYAPFITAYAKRNLISGILPQGDNFIYSDTDSIKVISGNPLTERYIEWYNSRIESKIYCTLKHYNIDAPEVLRKCGKWTQDGSYTEFKALGQKKYLYRDVDGIHGCIAGLRKETADGLTFEDFNDNYIIPKEYSGAVSVSHSDQEWSAELPDRDGVISSVHEYGSYTEKPVEYSLSAEHDADMILSKIIEGAYNGA